jgi:tagatose 1,6-diphosphate aldolase
MKMSEGKLKHLKALSNHAGVIAAAAMDQRGSLQKSLASARGVDKKEITHEMMSEFKTAVTKVLTPHASAILLDPEFGLEARLARSKNAGLLLAYELSGYDNTQPGRLPDLLPHVSVKRIVDWGADAVKILIYYTPFEDAKINDIKHAFIERIGAECETYDIPFFLEFVGYDPKGGDEKGFEYAKAKPEIVKKSMEEFSKPQYFVDVLKVEVPINAEFVEGSAVYKGQTAYTQAEAKAHFRHSRRDRQEAFHLSERGRQQRAVCGIAAHGHRSRHGFLRRALRPRHLERRHPGVRQERRESAGRLAIEGRREEHQRRERRHQVGHAVVRQAGRAGSGISATIDALNTAGRGAGWLRRPAPRFTA